MHVSQQGKSFIASFEKFRAFPYQDQAGKWTVGFGHLITPDDPDFSAGLTNTQAADLFSKDLAEKAERPIALAVQVALNQHEYDSLASLCYNVGAGNFASSHLVRYLNCGKPVQVIADQFLLWDKEHLPDGTTITSDGLYARRVAERDIFLKGIYSNHS